MSHISNWINEFDAWLAAQEMSANTRQAYLGDIESYAAWYAARYGQPFRPADLTAADLRAYKRHLVEERKLAPATINRKLAAQRTFNRWVNHNGALSANPAANVALVAEPAPAPRWLDRQQANRLLAAYERAANAEAGQKRPTRHRQALMQRAIALLQRGAGLRTHEVISLDLGDLTLRPRSGQVVVRQGKGGRYAQVPLPLESRQALEEWIDLRGDLPGPLFRSQKGGRLSARQVQRYFAQMSTRAGLEGEYSPHSWRHTFVRRLVADPEVPLAEAQQLARHSRTELTLRYAMAGQNELQTAVERGMAD